VLVAVDPTSAPFGTTGTDGQPAGYDVDVAKLVAKYMGVQLELVPVTSTNRIPFLLTNRVDMVISLFSITPERALQVWFSDPYAVVGTIVVRAQREDVQDAGRPQGREGRRAARYDPDMLLSQKEPDAISCGLTTKRRRSRPWSQVRSNALGSSTTALGVINRKQGREAV